ncbi:MAG TPA: SsrA-binding protein SmpB [Candidatus Azoamicus sp.]
MDIIMDLNKRISYNYFIKEQYEAGIVLYGWEVKSVRMNGISLIGSFISINNFLDIFLVGSFINSTNFIFNYNELDLYRNRYLLLKKKEILYLYSSLKIKGYTLVPSKAYWKNSFLKIEISLCFGKKLYDKRHILKNRDIYKNINSYITN